MRQLLVALMLALAAACSSAPAEPAPPNADFAGLESRVRAGEFGNVHGLVVARGNAVLKEAYFTGPDEMRGIPLGLVTYGPDVPHDVRSITKTVVALLYGVALAEGRAPPLDTPAVEAFPEYANLVTPERRAITIGHMLSMSSGLAWDEFTYPYQDARNSERLMTAAPDPLRYVFSQPTAHPPGAQWTYSGGDVEVVAHIIARGVGMPLEAYADRVLFQPLGITHARWLKDQRGVAYAASGLRLTPRELVSLGQLLMQRGAWNGRQIAPAAWVDAMLTPHATVEGAPPCGMRYGYFTWLGAQCEQGAQPVSFCRRHWVWRATPDSVPG